MGSAREWAFVATLVVLKEGVGSANAMRNSSRPSMWETSPVIENSSLLGTGREPTLASCSMVLGVSYRLATSGVALSLSLAPPPLHPYQLHHFESMPPWQINAIVLRLND